ncbi:MAG: aminotransferase class III-fold pyridoxal phosphate-dependent enzyme [Candidatus Saccharicenans sp.]|jgi:glutamate-1-semialdehyde 2,1-aminomutase|nr:aminotransferase class III-fold pyridoxal phosphate-dependent enzyme [Candidatus Saccharicenans sp.]MDH7574292.1 aminotransferase class III-fold pyridoxal phosphate-dependent enzyme [Candidatus Saccharicenans sp.]
MEKLFRYLEREYRKKTAKSAALFRRASRVMVRGGSHSLRLWKPYPFFPVSAAGAEVSDVDGNRYLDYWQGHYANILGHNPEVIRRAVEPHFQHGTFHTGFETLSQVELAERLLASLGRRGLKVRFTTSGTLASTYAVMLAMGYTGRQRVLKVGGGWHGASPYLLKGVKFQPGAGFRAADSAGVPPEFSRQVLITRFNDCQHLSDVFQKHGRKLAAFILEPFIGVGGFLFCSRQYLELARQLCDRYGVVLIFDEIISGFRFCASGLQKLYGLSPDISLFGKLIGGGQAVAAVVGKAEIMEGCEPSGLKHRRVHFEGGTFSSHEEYMRAGLAMLDYLEKNQHRVYPYLGQQAEKLRRGIERVFREEGLEAVCTGDGHELVPDSSFFMVNFPRKKIDYRQPEDLWNPERSNVTLREEVLKLALLLNGVHVVHGGGCLSTAHTPEDVDRTIQAYAEAARIFRRFL